MMKEDELRDFIKKQVCKTIDSIYNSINNADNLKPKSKYSFNITINNPFTNEVTSKKLTFQGDEIIAVRDFIRNNKVKANTIRRVLKKEAWKIVYSAIKENSYLK